VGPTVEMRDHGEEEQAMGVTVEQPKDTGDKNLITVTLTGRLTAADYDEFVPAVEKAIRERGKIRFLMIMKDFHGWDAGAAWEDIKFDVRHFSDIERVAMAGDKRWEKWMAALCKPFTTAKVRYFDAAQKAEAEEWVRA
jgi:SpoIIAA-like